MDTLSLVIAIVGVILTMASFVIGRLTAARTDGEKLGRMEEKIDAIDSNIALIREDVYRETTERHKAVERIHDRLDNLR